MTSQGTIGVFLGLVTAFFIGLFMVPRRYAKTDTVSFMVGMTAGACVGSGIYWLACGMPFVASWYALASLLPGVNWALGSYAYAWGTERIGLSKATGIKNTQVVVTTLGGFLIFNDAATTEPVLAVMGSALVVVTAVVLTGAAHSEERIPNASRAGYLVPVISSVLYGINGLIMAWIIGTGISKPEMNAGIGVGSFLAGAILYVVVKRDWRIFSACCARDHALSFAGGVIWAVAMVTMILSIAYAGLAVGWSLMNLSVVVSVLYGVVILKEIDPRRWPWHIYGGLAIACVGIAALYFSKTLPPDFLTRHLGVAGTAAPMAPGG